MRAWTVDADDIQIADDLDAALLHRTSWIESFLEQKRSDQFIVTATKGFGKTLLYVCAGPTGPVAVSDFASAAVLPEPSRAER